MSYSLLIDGRKVQGVGRIDVVDPSTGSVFDSAPRADEALALQAIAASSNAGKSWAGLGYAGRRVYLHDFANAIESRTEELAAVLNRERAFGGAKESGMGLQNGVQGMEDFTQRRIVNVALD